MAGRLRPGDEYRRPITLIAVGAILRFALAGGFPHVTGQAVTGAGPAGAGLLYDPALLRGRKASYVQYGPGVPVNPAATSS